MRMLGRGRPFILEFINPKKSVSCYQRVDEMRELANQFKDVRGLEMKIATRQDFDELKASCTTKAKSYCALVWTKIKMDQQTLDEKLNTI